MPVKKYTDEQKKFISQNVKGTTTKELVRLVNDKFKLNLTENQMRSYKKNHALKSGTLCGLEKGSPTRSYPENIKKFIYEHYIGVGPTEMTKLLNKTFNKQYSVGQIKGYYSRNKLDSGIDGHFSKGSIPFNKGKKKYWIGGEETQFKKGHIPVNYRAVGSERINVDGYVEIKVADPNKWRLKHQVIWEETNGPIPKGYAVIFGDGNSLNLKPGNLVLVSRAQLSVMNRKRLIQNNAELTRTGAIIADVYLKISERKRKANR